MKRESRIHEADSMAVRHGMDLVQKSKDEFAIYMIGSNRQMTATLTLPQAEAWLMGYAAGASARNSEK